MIICSCGKKIEYFIVIANDAQTSLNSSNRPIIHHSLFACGKCVEKVIKRWKDHNKYRNEPYLVKKVGINVTADTKKEFIRKVNPQLFSQFTKTIWWLPKSDIQVAVRRLKKN